MKRLKNNGQATTELTVLLPLFVLLAGGMISIVYICWQGIKVQQAANLAARMQGQERISGSFAPNGNVSVGTQSIREDNGTNGDGDTIPGDVSHMTRGAMSGRQPPTGGLYGRIYKEVQKMFSSDEQNQLFIPKPTEGINTDTVQVARVLVPGTIFNMKLPPIKLEATAYGGEDPHMYSMPRWGRTSTSNDPFYQSQINKGSE